MAVSSLISKTVLQHVLKPSICRSIATLPKAHLPPASAWLSWVTKNKSKLYDVGWNILDENTAGSWWDVCKGEDGLPKVGDAARHAILTSLDPGPLMPSTLPSSGQCVLVNPMPSPPAPWTSRQWTGIDSVFNHNATVRVGEAVKTLKFVSHAFTENFEARNHRRERLIVSIGRLVSNQLGDVVATSQDSFSYSATKKPLTAGETAISQGADPKDVFKIPSIKDRPDTVEDFECTLPSELMTPTSKAFDNDDHGPMEWMDMTDVNVLDSVAYTSFGHNLNRIHWDFEYARSMGHSGIVLSGPQLSSIIQNFLFNNLSSDGLKLDSVSVRAIRPVTFPKRHGGAEPMVAVTLKGGFVSPEKTEKGFKVWASLTRPDKSVIMKAVGYASPIEGQK